MPADRYGPVVTLADTADPRLDSGRSWMMVGVAFASTFTVFGVAYSFGAFFEEMSAEFDTGRGLTALLFSLTTFLYFVLGMYTGRWSDRTGPTPVLVTGAVSLGTGLLLTSLAPNIWFGLAAYSAGVGIAVACCYVPVVSVVGGWFEHHRTAALGVAVAGIGTGTLVMAPVASIVIDEVGWRSAYRLFGVVGAAILLLCALVAERPPVHAEVPPPARLQELVTIPSFRLLYGSAFLMSVALFVPFVFLADYAEDQGLSSGLAAALVGFIGGSSIIGRLALGAVAGRVGLVRLYQGCFFVMGIAFVIWLVAGDNVALLVTFTVVLGVSYGGFIALSPAVAADAFGTAGLGGVLGALYTSAGVGGLIGPPLAGAIIDETGRYGPAITMATLLTFAAFAVLLGLRTDRSDA